MAIITLAKFKCPHCVQAKIHGDRDVFVQEGSDINLTCTALSTPEQPERVTWRHNNLDLHRSNINILQ